MVCSIESLTKYFSAVKALYGDFLGGSFSDFVDGLESGLTNSKKVGVAVSDI